jgi:hypothetical protein
MAAQLRRLAIRKPARAAIGELTAANCKPRDDMTTLDKRIWVGALNATGVAYVCLAALDVLTQGFYDGLVAVLFMAAVAVLALSWIVLPMGALLGIWLPRFVARRSYWSSLGVGVAIGVGVSLTVTALLLWPDIDYATSRHTVLSKSAFFGRDLWCGFWLSLICIVWLGAWALVCRKRLMHENPS